MEMERLMGREYPKCLMYRQVKFDWRGVGLTTAVRNFNGSMEEYPPSGSMQWRCYSDLCWEIGTVGYCNALNATPSLESVSSTFIEYSM